MTQICHTHPGFPFLRNLDNLYFFRLIFILPDFSLSYWYYRGTLPCVSTKIDEITSNHPFLPRYSFKRSGVHPQAHPRLSIHPHYHTQGRLNVFTKNTAISALVTALSGLYVPSGYPAVIPSAANSSIHAFAQYPSPTSLNLECSTTGGW